MHNAFSMILWRWRLLFADRRLLLVALLLPPFLSLGTGAIFQDYQGINRIPIDVIDLDNTNISLSLIQNLKTNESLDIFVPKNSKEALKHLENNKIEAIFTIKNGFSQGLLSGNLDKLVDISFLENNLIAGALGDIFAREIIKKASPYKAAERAKSILNDPEVYEKTKSRVETHIENPQFSLSVKTIFRAPKEQKQTDKSNSLGKQMAQRFAIGMTLAVSAFYVIFIGASTIEERKKATFSRLYTTGNQPLVSIFWGYASFGTAVVCIQFLFLNGVLHLFSPVFYGKVFLLAVAFSSIFTGIGLFTASFFDKPTAYQSIAAPLVFFICLMGGAFWSLELIPSRLSWIKFLSPVYWILEGFLGLCQNQSPSFLPLLILLLFGFIFTFLAALKSKAH